jgi:hypothetical protein
MFLSQVNTVILNKKGKIIYVLSEPECRNTHGLLILTLSPLLFSLQDNANSRQTLMQASAGLQEPNTSTGTGKQNKLKKKNISTFHSVF